MPNGPQANPQQFQQQNSLPYNFNSNTGGYDDQNKDYNNYNPQNQIKPSTGANLNNVSELGGVSGYQKNVNVEKANAGGYHTPPPNFPTSLLNQQTHPNVNTTSAQAPPQYTYIASMMGTPGTSMVHTGIQVSIFSSYRKDPFVIHWVKVWMFVFFQSESQGIAAISESYKKYDSF